MQRDYITAFSVVTHIALGLSDLTTYKLPNVSSYHAACLNNTESSVVGRFHVVSWHTPTRRITTEKGKRFTVGSVIDQWKKKCRSRPQEHPQRLQTVDRTRLKRMTLRTRKISVFYLDSGQPVCSLICRWVDRLSEPSTLDVTALHLEHWNVLTSGFCFKSSPVVGRPGSRVLRHLVKHSGNTEG